LTLFRPRFSAAPGLVQGALLALVAMAIQFMGAAGSAPFVYQRF